MWHAKVTQMKTATSAAVTEQRVMVCRILLAARGEITSFDDTRTAIRENTPAPIKHLFTEKARSGLSDNNSETKANHSTNTTLLTNY